MNEETEIKLNLNKNVNIQKTKTIGQSKFYDVTSVAPEKQDEMKPDDAEEEGVLKIVLKAIFVYKPFI